MSETEQITRNRAMQERIRHYSVGRWANDFISKLQEVGKMQEQIEAKKLNREAWNRIVSAFQGSRRRLILSDYDGTLVPFAKRPEEAKPDNDLVKLLGELTADPRNEVVLISGRDRHNLEEWFASLKLGVVAEHGAWTKKNGQGWKMNKSLTSDWKKEIRPILELSVSRMPGSFIEEKEFSLAWHYRRADPKISELRAREIVNDLLNLTANCNLQVLEGSKVVEVKSAAINKGQAALAWVSQEKWDFILAIGDDLTDEDIFQILPPTAWSIKVRYGASLAKYNLDSPREVRTLLQGMIGSLGTVSSVVNCPLKLRV